MRQSQAGSKVQVGLVIQARCWGDWAILAAFLGHLQDIAALSRLQHVTHPPAGHPQGYEKHRACMRIHSNARLYGAEDVNRHEIML